MPTPMNPLPFPAPVIPNRRTHVRMDVATPMMVELPFALERKMARISRISDSQRNHVQFRAGAGWELETYFDQYDWAQERTEGQSQWLTGSNLTVAPGVTAFTMYRAPSNAEQPNVLTGASPNIATTGQAMFQKGVPASDNWDAAILSADQTAYPSPNTAEDTIVMDRIARTPVNKGMDRWYMLALNYGGASWRNPHVLGTFFFPGPAGWTEGVKGVGHYALKMRANGMADLYESTTATGSNWVKRTSFKCDDPNQTQIRMMAIYIRPTACLTDQGGPGGSIVFHIKGQNAVSPGAHNALIETILATAINAISSKIASTNAYVYRVPKFSSGKLTRHDAPLRLDLRRDLKCKFGIAQGEFYTAGTLQDDTFTLPSPMTDAKDMYLEWDSCEPVGTAIDGTLHDADTGLELTLIGSAPKLKLYRLEWPKQRYFASFAFSTSDIGASPLLRAYKVHRESVVEMPDQGEFEPAQLVGIEMTGAEFDPSGESAIIRVKDETNSFPVLATRSSIATVIEQEYDPADESKRIRMIRGFAQRADARRMFPIVPKAYGSPDAADYPSADGKEYTIHMVGEAQRLNEQCFGAAVHQFWDYVFEKPMKASDRVKEELMYAGYPDYMINVADSPIRLFPGGTDDRTVINPLTNLGEDILDIHRTYTGHILRFDPNYGTYGAWRTAPPPFHPYTFVAAFVRVKAAVNKIIPHDVTGYPPPVTGGGLTYATGAVTAWYDEPQSSVDPPEANLVRVSAIGEVGIGGTPSVYTATLINPASYNFYPDTPTADRDSPDYIGRLVPLWFMAPSLVGGDKADDDTGSAVGFACRRIYDVSAHAIKTLRFMAPLIDVPHDQAGKRRFLQYYDPVTVDGQPFLVRNVNPVFNKDGFPMAYYELQAPNDVTA